MNDHKGGGGYCNTSYPNKGNETNSQTLSVVRGWASQQCFEGQEHNLHQWVVGHTTVRELGPWSKSTKLKLLMTNDNPQQMSVRQTMIHQLGSVVGRSVEGDTYFRGSWVFPNLLFHILCESTLLYDPYILTLNQQIYPFTSFFKIYKRIL